MSREQYMWGLSNGVTVFAVASAFWLGLAAWTVGTTSFVVVLAPILLVGGVLAWKGIELRRRAPGFSPAELRNAPKGSPTRRIIVVFYAVSAAQWVSIVLVGTICMVLNRSDLTWPLIGLVVSLHFLPLGWLFGVRPYYVAGVVGIAIPVIAIWVLTDGGRLVAVGLGLGLTAVACATYVVAKADAIADQALNHTFPAIRS